MRSRGAAPARSGGQAAGALVTAARSAADGRAAAILVADAMLDLYATRYPKPRALEAAASWLVRLLGGDERELERAERSLEDVRRRQRRRVTSCARCGAARGPLTWSSNLCAFSCSECRAAH